jgi:hypothetical protein
MNFKVSRYGWIPDLPDFRDYLYAAPAEGVATNLASDFWTICVVA